MVKRCLRSTLSQTSSNNTLRSLERWRYFGRLSQTTTEKPMTDPFGFMKECRDGSSLNKDFLTILKILRQMSSKNARRVISVALRKSQSPILSQRGLRCWPSLLAPIVKATRFRTLLQFQISNRWIKVAFNYGPRKLKSSPLWSYKTWIDPSKGTMNNCRG